MIYLYLATFVTIFHTFLILFVLFGILISVRYSRFRPIESIVLIIAIIIWSLYGGCPLTYLESFLRFQAGTPLPITEVGFIPFYLGKWFGLSATGSQVKLFTYILSFVFFATSIEWISPFVNPEIIKLRKFLYRKYKTSLFRR